MLKDGLHGLLLRLMQLQELLCRPRELRYVFQKRPQLGL